MVRSFGLPSKVFRWVQLFILLFSTNLVRAEQFHTAKLIAPPVVPGAMAAGDLNGDGNADLVYTGAVVHILISNGDGTFKPETTLDPGMATGAVAIADVNGDGHPDIVVVGNGGTATATASVFLGNGDGTFQTPPLTSIVAQSTANFPDITALALADFDGDGHLDLLASDALNGGVTFSKGDGLGHFSLQRSLPENGGPGQILVADLNHDGHLDFAVHSVSGADEQVFIGNGDGTFASAVSYRGPNNVTGAALVDVDGDGNLDLVISDFNNNVDILLGRSDGTFSNTPAAAGVFYGGAAGGVFAAGDFNHDGRPDIAVISRNGITILLGAPGLTFTVAGTYAATSLPGTPAVGDFNGDGQLDFAVSGPFDKQIAILLGKPNGTLNAANAFEVGAAVNSVAIADINADGIPDLVVGTARSTPSVLLGLGSGNYRPPAEPPLLLVSTRGGSVETADFNGDGKLDLLFANGGSNAGIQLGNGDGTFQAALPVISNPAINTIINCARTADLNNDHKPDVLIDTIFLAGNGDGTFITPSGSFAFGGVFGCVPVIADFNKDGNLDVAFPQPASNNLSVQLGKGDGTFGPVTNFVLPNSAFDVAAGDFNGDGILDLVATNGANAVILLGNGDGTFQKPLPVATGGHSETQVAVGDVNGDGKLDLVFTDGFVITVLHGNGDGTFQPGVDYIAGTGASKPQLADLNGDGEIDIAFANLDINTATTVTVLLNQSGSTLSLTSSVPTSQFGQPLVLSGTVTPTVADSPVPTGTITITSDGGTLGSGALVAGSFGVTPATLAVGTHTIAGNYSGDSLYKPKTLPSLVQTVTQATTTSVLSTTANPNVFGQPLNVTAKVTPAFTGTPTGLVTFNEGTTVLGSVSLDGSGAAAIDLSSLSAGTHKIVANYAGDADFKASASATLSQQVFFPTTITVTESSSRQLTTSPFTVNVKISSPNGTPSGNVNLMDGSAVLGQLTLDQTGSASFSSTALPDGTHSLRAVYPGDGFFNPGTSSTLTYDVFDFSVSATPTAATISRGQSASFTLTVSPVDGFNGSVAFACQGLPAFASCAFNPSSLTPNGGPVSATLTVTTTAAALTSPWSGPGLLEGLWLAGLLGALMAAARELVRRSMQQGRLAALRFSLFAVAIAGCMLMVSCGGGGSSTPTKPPPTTTSITVSSTATSGAVSDSHSLAVSITVN